MNYEPRIIDQPLAEDFKELPAILIEGAKAVGKTATASRLAKTIMSLDNPQVKMLLRNNPEAILGVKGPVLIDEWQLEPNLWSFVRHQVDDVLPAESVLFTGSSIRVDARIHSNCADENATLFCPRTTDVTAICFCNKIIRWSQLSGNWFYWSKIGQLFRWDFSLRFSWN